MLSKRLRREKTAIDKKGEKWNIYVIVKIRSKNLTKNSHN